MVLIFSTLAGASLVVYPLESQTHPIYTKDTSLQQAIVVLGGGRISNAPEYGSTDRPSLRTLARIHYAARLARETGLPILVSGGSPDGSKESEAEIMARVLTDDLKVPVKWIEKRSTNTAENADASAKILRDAGISNIILVTDAMHMPRAIRVFKQTGLIVSAAPTLFFASERFTYLSFIPGGEGLEQSHYAFHEWLGLLWYRLNHFVEPAQANQ